MLWLRRLIRSQSRFALFHIGPRQATTPPAIRHVRFRRPWLRSFLGKTLLYGTAFHLWSSFVLIQFDEEDRDTHDVDSISEAEVKETTSRPSSQSSPDEGRMGDGVEEEDPLFIPLTWSRLQEGDLYAASDPEWQEFVKISKDRKNASSRMSQILGGPLSLTGFWLVHQFPSRAPPGYLRSGLEFTDDSISWVTKAMEPDVGDRLQTVMKPIHVALAIKDAYLIFLTRQLARLKDPNSQPSDALEVLNGRYILSGNERLSPISPNEQPKLPPLISDEAPNSISSHDNPDLPDLHPSSIISSLQRLPLPDLGPGSDLHLASMAFKLRLNEYRAQNPRTPQRGTFFISGPVGLKGPDGFCRFEVRGEYDPAKSAWRTVEMKLKDINPRRQRPRGSA
ncbi:hypothetical protein N7462_008772 [Penicillium macrosclerotiorum]|uniref:uncharacterized protein n=1 Tax=Penicillium macrosclerotiorum TaxID=303699 RepID=UPI002549322D|nr:uncharacterized protein N7462_008772 [Penicillium macrosclerotiorum]KAJ5675875.1 hypothetical protein N7462_008772 [Penicillium macrosclerotiorum]